MFPLKRYLVLRDSVEALSDALWQVVEGKDVDLKIHLGANIYASVQTPYRCVNIREWFKDENGVKRPGHGVALNTWQWETFVAYDKQLDRVVPELKDTVRCMDANDHYNIPNALQCRECFPDSE